MHDLVSLHLELDELLVFAAHVSLQLIDLQIELRFFVFDGQHQHLPFVLDLFDELCILGS